MPRPTKFRRVEFFPDKTFFYPEGYEKDSKEEVVLKFEELEAIRLKDLEKMNQEECAEKMGISRQTFQNIIESAREKVAKALTDGKAINISGGHYTIKECRYVCKECGSVYEVEVEHDKRKCPECRSNRVGCKRRRQMCNRCRETE